MATKKGKRASKSQRSRQLRLPMTPLPKDSWYRDLGRALPTTEWHQLRDYTLRRADTHCTTCGAKGALRVDGDWEFDDRRRIQRLVGLSALCQLCYLTRHPDQAEQMAEQGRLGLELVVRHFRELNRCSLKAYEEHRAEALRTWERRSKKDWQVDLSIKDELLGAGPHSSSGDWLDAMAAGAEERRRQRRDDAAVLQRFYRRHGLEPEQKRLYRPPAVRSVKV